ncbi:DNA-binding protein HU-beta [Humidesulfovibrio mexicanus]|uniref:DNA-binding protein HU-beta n=1 Tax=Humidesulfovibrio mexicanus TaxID=147047 RepID=A0A238XKA5_9BACT|nr:HU family DNA-binding protein [Humidesulfovibrio mexicanus]SNR59446.1 DNA-binding protein HU-beta [Humidesulfovibrio mexicanus]
MKKSELISWISKLEEMPQGDVERVLDRLGAVVVTELSGGPGEVSLPGIGKLKANQRNERAGYNPKTGKPIRIPARITVKLTLSQSFKNSLRG